MVSYAKNAQVERFAINKDGELNVITHNASHQHSTTIVRNLGFPQNVSVVTASIYQVNFMDFPGVRRYAKHLAFLNWCNSFNELKASCNL
jgi:hypothetical protein